MKILVEAYLDANLGDDMMLRCVLSSFPQHSFYAYCDDASLAVGVRDLRNLTLLPRREIIARGKDHYDAFLIVGGSMFQAPNLRAAASHAIKLAGMAILKARGAKILIVWCNIGPITSRLGRALIIRRLKLADMITVRDHRSLEFVRSYGQSCQCYPDMVLSAPLVANSPRGACLGISTFGAQHRTLNHYTTLARVADLFIERFDQPVLLLAFDSAGEGDLLAAHRIRELMHHRDRSEIVPYRGNPQDIITALTRCSRLIAIRFHSLVLALRMGIPFVPVMYSAKTGNYLDDVGYVGPRYELGHLAEGCADELMSDLCSAPQQMPKVDDIDIQASSGHIVQLKDALNGVLPYRRARHPAS